MADGSLSTSSPAVPSAAPLPTVFAGLRIVSLCTLLSRILGLVRDVGMAAVFGNGPAMDAFSVAFRVPNLVRLLFGEGALTAAFLPVFVAEWERAGRESAWKLASAVLTVLAIGLSGLVLAGELTLWAVALLFDWSPEGRLLLSLTALLLPYLLLICLSAQVCAVLNALGHFTWPALVPVVLNVVWIAALWTVVPWFSTPTAQIHVVAGCVLAAGVLQLAAPLPVLWRLGFRYATAWSQVRGRVAEIARAMLPVVVGLSITQVNTLSDSLIAWGFARPEAGAAAMSLPGSPPFPVESGTASALYFGQRLYQFPLGVFGVALGTVLFPLLSRHAGRGRLDLLRDDLTLGLRLVLCVGLPASAGLVLLAPQLTALFFQHGAFDADDARQTAGIIAAYGGAVWAYCGLLIVHRGYYAAGDRQTPLRVGLAAVVVNLTLNLTLIWPLGGQGLAAATALTAMLQVVAVTAFLRGRVGRLDWSALAGTALRSLLATALMTVACLLTLTQVGTGAGLTDRLLAAAVPLTASVAAYFAAARLLGLRELRLLFTRERPDGRGQPD